MKRDILFDVVHKALGIKAVDKLHLHFLKLAALGVSPFALQIPTSQDIAQGRVTSPDQSEITRGNLYDFQLYATAGATQMQFFALPIGQGIATALGAVVGSAKSKHDTNLQVANTLPSGKAFFAESIEYYAFPGASAAANTYTPANPAQFAAANAAIPQLQVADVNTLLQSGTGELFVLDKTYVRETPMMSFPQQVGMSVDAALATTSATAGEIAVLNAHSAGRAYTLDIPFTLLPAQNFGFNVDYPGLVATPSGFNARVGIKLFGWFIRATQ